MKPRGGQKAPGQVTQVCFLLLDKASFRRAGIARVFLRLCVLSVACFSSKQCPSNSQGYAGFDHFHAFPGLGLPPLFAGALRGLPALYDLPPSGPGSLPFAGFRPFLCGLPGLPSLFRAVCSLFSNCLLLRFRAVPPCPQFL